MVQAAGDRRQVGHRLGDVARSFLEEGAPLVLRHRPPGRGLADRDQCGAQRLGAAQRRRDGIEPLQFAGRRVAGVAHHAAQPPATLPPIRRFISQRQMRSGRQRLARNGRDSLDAPVAARAGRECDSKRLGHGPRWVQDARRPVATTLAGDLGVKSRFCDWPRAARRTRCLSATGSLPIVSRNAYSLDDLARAAPGRCHDRGAS